MLESFPLVPLFGHQGVGIALLSYDGQLCWGFSADRDIVPDLHDLVESVRDAFAELCDMAGLARRERPSEPRRGVRRRMALRRGHARWRQRRRRPDVAARRTLLHDFAASSCGGRSKRQHS